MNKFAPALFAGLLAPALLFGSALVTETSLARQPDDPITVTLNIDQQGEAHIAISNKSADPVAYRSDIPAVLSKVFLDFPVEGALQFRDAKGNHLKINGESESRWWHPILMSSTIFSDPPGDLSSILLKPHSVKQFKVNCRKVLFHVAGMSGGSVASDFRWSLPFKVEDGTGKVLTVRGESPWAPMPAIGD